MLSNSHVRKLNTALNKLPLYYFVIPFALHFYFTDVLANSSKLIQHHPPLHDVIMSNMPDLSKFDYVPNLLVAVIFSIFAKRLFKDKDTKLAKSYFKYFAIIIFLRTITTQVTLIPAQSVCTIPRGIDRYLNGHCIDKIFSGHTSATFLIVLLYYKYGIVKKPYIYVLMALQMIMAFSLIVTKNHYTIDVILAYMITGAVFLLLDL